MDDWCLKIDRRMDFLAAGTVIVDLRTIGGAWELKTAYDRINGCYYADLIEYDYDGEVLILETNKALTLDDLIGCYIMC